MTNSFLARRAAALLFVAVAAGCSGPQQAPPQETPAASTPMAPAETNETPIPATASPYDVLPEGVRAVLEKPSTGDLDEMLKRRAIRVAVTFNRTHYFIDRGEQRGLTYEALKAFETDLNTDLKTGNIKVHVVILPMSRDQLSPALLSGKVDMVAAMVTVRPELEKLAAFSEPTRTNVSQVVVTGPGAPPITALDDLAGQAVFVRKGSAYEESIIALNAQLKARASRRSSISEAPGGTRGRRRPGDGERRPGADHRRRRLSGGVLEPGIHRLHVHKDVAVRSGGVLAVAFRKENPKLRAAVNEWIKKHGKGDAFRNVHRAPLPQGRQVREECRVRSGAQEVPGSGRDVQEVRRPVQPGLPADGGAGLPGIDTRPERQESRRRDRRDAGHAPDRQGNWPSATSARSIPTSTPA